VELLTKKLHQKVRLLLATESAMKLKNKKKILLVFPLTLDDMSNYEKKIPLVI
jgi:hypothetical protein